ncbi:MAG: hypothetical protein IT439_00380 [Phycisphaerales bacterium]|nr:hypothetical protein [Phycisphaerales bacterium]
MPEVQVNHERETPRGWEYDVTVTRAGGGVSTHLVTLAWVDHDHWSGGCLPPSVVVERLVQRLAGRPDLPARFDASQARRWDPDLDRVMTRTG